MAMVINNLHPEPLGRVLDFGCGVGRIYNGLKPFEYYVGVDISQSYLSLFRRASPNVFLVQIKNFQIPLLEDDFDTVICYSVFTHMYPEHIDLILAEFHRVLKPGGTALASIFDLAVVKAPQVHNWIMIELQRFFDLCKKHHFKVIGRFKMPEMWGSHQTLFILENQE